MVQESGLVCRVCGTVNDRKIRKNKALLIRDLAVG